MSEVFNAPFDAENKESKPGVWDLHSIINKLWGHMTSLAKILAPCLNGCFEQYT